MGAHIELSSTQLKACEVLRDSQVSVFHWFRRVSGKDDHTEPLAETN